MTKKNSIASVASRIGLAFGMTESDPKRHALLSVGIEGIDDGSTSGSTPSTDLERPVSKGLSDAIDLSTSRQTRTDTPEFVLSPQVAPSDVHRGAAFHTWNDLPKSGHATSDRSNDCGTGASSKMAPSLRNDGSHDDRSNEPKPLRHILIAEDDDLISHALKSMLESKGRFSVTTVGDFEGLTGALDQRPGFDSIILDLHMPGMSGLASVRTIKQKAADCPVLIFTGDDQASAIDLFSAGVSGVVFKTSGLAVIKTALKKVISGRRFIPDTGFPRKSGTAQARTSRSRIDVRKVRRTLLLRGLLAE